MPAAPARTASAQLLRALQIRCLSNAFELFVHQLAATTTESCQHATSHLHTCHDNVYTARLRVRTTVLRSRSKGTKGAGARQQVLTPEAQVCLLGVLAQQPQ